MDSEKRGFIPGAMLIAQRKATKLNQTEFWARVGVTQSGGSRYESGRAIPKPVQLLLQLAYGTEGDAHKVFEKLRLGTGNGA